ncbi:MAG: hypothetical protein IKI03_02440 [Clostridia bacterium]|nr:hypothetical protein [Clostridia bacterium]
MKHKGEIDDRICKFCEKSNEIPLTGNMLCPRKGIVDPLYVCGQFKYDPFKRIPKRPKPDTDRLEMISLDD